MDLRIEKTEKSIFEALIELRAKKPIERIKIKDICAKAKINKSTFYSHYTDIFDLSEKLEMQVVRSVFESLAHPEYIFDKPREFTQELYESFAAHNSLIKILFADSRCGYFIQRLYKSIIDLIFDRYPQYKDNPRAKIVLSYSIYGGYYAITENSEYEKKTLLDTLVALTSQAHNVLDKI